MQSYSQVYRMRYARSSSGKSKGGLLISDDSLAEAGTIAREWSALLEDLFAKEVPSSQLWPFPAEWDWPKEVAGKPVDSYLRWMELVVPVSLAGLPCVMVPAGLARTDYQ
jgi:amidase